MSVSILSCSLDRKTADLATFKVEKTANIQGGSYKLGFDIVMAAICGPINVYTLGLGASPDPLPALWSTYSYQGDTDAHSYCKSVVITRDLKAEKLFYAIANFEPAEPGEIPDGGGAPIKSVADPVLRKPVYWWDREVFTNVDSADQSGSVLRNPANNLYEELEEHERPRGLLVVEWNVATLAETLDISRKFELAVNATTWSFKERILPDRSAMVRSVSAGDLHSEGAYNYYPMSMRLAFADLGKNWDIPKPEIGKTYFVKNSGGYLTANGYRKRVQAPSPVPLASDGTRLPDGEPVGIRMWRVRREVDFGTLPFMSIA